MTAQSADTSHAGSATDAAAVPTWLAEMKASPRDRPLDKAKGRWLGDFLDQETPSGLLPAEMRLLEACAEGVPCYAFDRLAKTSRDRITVDVPEPSSAGVRRRSFPYPWTAYVRASFLRFLALGGDESAPVHEAGVELRDAFVDGEVDLRGGTCVGRLALIQCLIYGPLKIEDGSLGILSLEGSRVNGIFGNRARIAGSLFLNKGFGCKGTVSLFGAKIEGSVLLGDAWIRYPEDQTAMVFSAATIGGDVSLDRGFSAEGCIWFNGADIRGKLTCRDACIIGTYDTSLNCTSAKIRGDVALNGAFRARGCVRLGAAAIGGDLDCTSGHFASSGECALNCNGTIIAGAFRLDFATTTGCASLAYARVAMDLSCVGAALSGAGAGAHGVALVADSATVGGSVFLTEAAPDMDGAFGQSFVARGGVTFNGAEVGQGLYCWGGQFINAPGVAFDLSASRIRGSLHLTQAYYGPARIGRRFLARGSVALYGARIERDLVCGGGIFRNTKGNALALDAARIEGAAILNQIWGTSEAPTLKRFTARGTVSLNRARIGGDLNCIGGSFKAPDKGEETFAIQGQGLVVGGCVFMGGPSLDVAGQNPDYAGFSSKGGVDLTAAQIGMQFNCVNGEFEHTLADKDRKESAAYALNLGISTIKYELLLGPMGDVASKPATIRGSLNLGGTKTRQLADRGFVDDHGPAHDHFPAAIVDRDDKSLRCDLTLDGFSYERLNGDSCLTARGRKAWLMRQSPSDLSKDFRHQPFDHLVRVLRAMGHDDEARDIAIFKQQRLTRRTEAFWKVAAVLGVVAACLLLFFGHRWAAAIVAALLLATEARTWLWRVVFELLIGYGYRPAQGLVIALVIAMGTGWFYQQAEENKALAHHQAEPDKGAPTEPAARFHPYIYSFDVMLPVVKLGEAEAWKPARREFTLHFPSGLGEFGVAEDATQYVVWMEMIFGWLAGGILLALVSGLLKKD